jgi:ABC-2 type transport system permease protein
MKKVLFIALKEVRDFFRDKGDLAFSLVLPIAIFALIYGALGGSNLFNGTAYIVNEDPGTRYSNLLIERLGSVNGLNLEMLSRADAESKIERSDLHLAVFIPQGFSDQLAAGQATQIVFKQRGNGGIEGQIVASLVRGAAERIGQELQVQKDVQTKLAGSGISQSQIEFVVRKFLAREEAAPSVTIQETSIGSSPDPINQFLPGIMTMFVLFAINMTAQTLVEERRKGTLERLMTTRLKTGELFMGKFLAYTSRGFVQTLILMLLAWLVFGFFTPLSFLESALIALIFAAAASTLGLIIGSVSKTENQATWISVFFTMLMVIVSGTFIAVEKGTVLYTLGRFSINTYANDAFGTIMAGGGSLLDVKTDLLVLLGVVVAGLIVSRLLFRASQGGK